MQIKVAFRYENTIIDIEKLARPPQLPLRRPRNNSEERSCQDLRIVG